MDKISPYSPEQEKIINMMQEIRPFIAAIRRDDDGLWIRFHGINDLPNKESNDK